MSEFEIRGMVRSFIDGISYTATRIRSEYVGFEKTHHTCQSPPSRTPIRVSVDEPIYGIRVFVPCRALKDLIKLATDENSVKLIDIYIHSSGDTAEAVLILKSRSEKGIWHTVAKISEYIDANMIEIIKPRRGYERIFVNLLEYPPMLGGRPLTLMPRELLEKLVSLLNPSQAEELGKNLGILIKRIIDTSMDLALCISIMRSLGFVDDESIYVGSDGSFIKVNLGSQNMCRFIYGFMNVVLEYSELKIENYEPCVLLVKK